MGYRIGIDIGGTFTDCVAFDDRGELVLEKVLTRPEDLAAGVMDGLGRLAARLGTDVRGLLGATESVVHGTTVGDNALIELRGAVTGLLTTKGFRDELDLRRGYKEDIWDVRLPAPPPLVPRRRRLTVPERIGPDGSVIEPLDEEAARAAIRRLGAQGVESVAVSLLFSFVNPAHELRLAELLAEELPGVSVSLSHQVMPKAPEFERTSTTVVNAFLAPRVSAYLDRLTDLLRQAGYGRDLLVMQSSGGIMTRDYIRERPVSVLVSGPAGGVIGGAAVASAKGAPDALCVDMGGTSYDISVVRSGRAPAEPGWNWHHRYLIGLPMIDVTTLGAGGGSIASVTGGVLRVGPESAGALPGPVCYGRGGTRPTVTDANLVLGLLSPDAEFAGGQLRLTRQGVDEAIEEHVAGPLGCSVEQAAWDISRLVNATMAMAVRRRTAEKGIDPVGLTMLAYGGNGPVHAAVQADELGIGRVLVPRQSPAFSALGLLVADVRTDEEHSYLAPLPAADLARIAEAWAKLADRAAKYFGAAGFARDELRFDHSLNLRYPGQNWSLSVPVGTAVGATLSPDATLLAGAAERFHELHEAEHTYATRDQEPELTGVRLVATAPVRRPEFADAAVGGTQLAAPAGLRRANLGGGFSEVPCFHGRDLRPGHVLEGPAIVEESYTTVVVPPGWRAVLDGAGDYVLSRGASGRAS